MDTNIRAQILETAPNAVALRLTVESDADNPGYRTVALAEALDETGEAEELELGVEDLDLQTALEEFVETRRLPAGVHTLDLKPTTEDAEERAPTWRYVVTVCGRSRADDGLMTEAPTVHREWTQARDRAVSALLANVEGGGGAPSEAALRLQVPTGEMDFEVLYSDDDCEWKVSVTLVDVGA